MAPGETQCYGCGLRWVPTPDTKGEVDLGNCPLCTAYSHIGKLRQDVDRIQRKLDRLERKYDELEHTAAKLGTEVIGYRCAAGLS